MYSFKNGQHRQYQIGLCAPVLFAVLISSILSSAAPAGTPQQAAAYAICEVDFGEPWHLMPAPPQGADVVLAEWSKRQGAIAGKDHSKIYWFDSRQGVLLLCRANVDDAGRYFGRGCPVRQWYLEYRGQKLEFQNDYPSLADCVD